MATHHDSHGHAHGHGPTHAPGSDKAPAFIGLIVGGIALFAIMYGTVLLTNRQFAGHAAAPAAAGTTAPAAGH